jgi:peptidoglycan/LPS O-acetylase OafA/YrhL
MAWWPFAHWAAWLCGAVAAEAYTGVVKLSKWWSSPWAFVSLLFCVFVTNTRTFGAIAHSRLVARFVSLSAIGDFSVHVLCELSDILSALAFFILLNRWVSADRKGVPVSRKVGMLQRLGIISYSLYLVHVPVVVAIERVFQHFGIGSLFWENCLRYAIMLPLSIGCAWLFFMLVERWFLGRTGPSKKPLPGNILPAQQLT